MKNSCTNTQFPS